jgi:hypothetical protein
MYGRADVTKTFSCKGILNKSFGAKLIKLPISLLEFIFGKA